MRLYFLDKHISLKARDPRIRTNRPKDQVVRSGDRTLVRRSLLKANNESYVGGRTLDFHEFKDDWSSDADSGRRVGCCLIEHGDIIQTPGDNDAIMTSSTEKVTDTSTTVVTTTESTTTDSATDAFLSVLLFSTIFL